MITLPNGKICMNEQEAIQWLLDNNAIPFQCTANYAAGTEIGLGTIVNPTPAKVRVGSLIFFADSKVSTVVGVTSNSFIVSDQYNNLVDDIAYVTNVEINVSGHLITTLSDGQTIDAGQIKQISSITINASQHLVANYNDGTSVDLGSLGDYSNVDFTAKTLSQSQPNYSGNITVTTTKSFFTPATIYSKAEILNNIMHIVISGTMTENEGNSHSTDAMGYTGINLPSAIAEKIIDINGNSVHEVLGSSALICFLPVMVYNASTSTYIPARLEVWNGSAANQMNMIITANSNVTINPYNILYLSARFSLTLI